MKNPSQVFWFVVRVFVGFVYAYAGFTKLIEPIENFRGSIMEYEFFPLALVPVIAHVIPWFEFIMGVFLLLGYAPKLSANAIALLSVGFVLLLASSDVLLKEGSKFCGCFGQNALIKLTVRQVFVMDCMIFFASLKMASLKKHIWSLDAVLVQKRK